VTRKKREPKSPELIVKRKEFGEWYRRRRLETGFKGNELEPRVSRGQGYVSKVEGGVYPIQKDSICLLDMPVFIALGSIDDARKLLEGLEPMFGSIDKSLLEQIAAKASDYPDFWPRDSIDRDSIRRFAASIPEAFSSIPSLPKTESKPLPVEEKPLVSQPTQQRYVPLLIPPVPESEILTLDEMNLLILREESRQPDPKAMVGFWNLVGEAAVLPWLCQRSMLALALKRWDENLTVNHLEYLFLNAMVVETARRYSGQAEPLPTQLETMVRDLGCVAWLAIRLSEGNTPTPKISLANLQEHWPQSQVGDWGWLRQIARSGPTQLIVHEDGVCEFHSHVEAEFWAARYLLSISLDEILRIARSMGRPFGILRQAVSYLHFTHRDDMVQKVIETLLENSEPQQLQIRYLDAADLLAVCEAKTNQALRFLWKTVTEQLCELWEEIESPEWRDQMARTMRHLDCDSFRRMMKQILYSDTKLVEQREAALRGCAILGGSFAVETLKSVIADRVLKPKTPAPQINADEMRDMILVAAMDLPSIERALLVEFGAALDADYSIEYLRALSNVGNLPVLRALQRIAEDENARPLNREARWKLEEGYTPAHVALMAHELEICRNQKTSPTYQQVVRARFLLQRSFAVYRESSADYPGSLLPRTLAQELAQLWATIELNDDIRAEAAHGLTLAQAWPALEICLTTLPLVNQPEAEERPTYFLPDLLLRLSSLENKFLLERLLPEVVDPAQRALLVRCLGRAGGVVLDKRFESELSQPQDGLAAAAVEAVAYSLGMVAESRLKQIAATDQREVIRRKANEMLALIGSEAALPYLQAQLANPRVHDEACFQLAQLHHP